VDRLLDQLGLETTSLLGHSGGGVWALRYAMARSHRVDRLVVIGVPALPGTRCPTPHRMMRTPGLGRLMAHLPANRESFLRFAAVMGERDSFATLPDLVDLFLLTQRDPETAAGLRADLRELLSPFALLGGSGWGRCRVRPEELGRLAVPTLLVWGRYEPLGDADVARSLVDLIPDGRLQVLPGGHAPWLGHPVDTAAAVEEFVSARR
jgi:pimeloyl-ACP methyl ester carboxylesterase